MKKYVVTCAAGTWTVTASNPGAAVEKIWYICTKKHGWAGFRKQSIRAIPL